MVTRLKISPVDGMLMSRPGFDVSSTNTHRLVDPRFPNLQLHARGSGTMTVISAGSNIDVWERTWTYADLGFVPIGFVNARFASSPNIISYPATLPSLVYENTPVGQVALVNEYEFRPDAVRVRCSTPANAPSPIVAWMVMKHPREP